MLQRIGYGVLAIAVLVLLFVQDVVIAREAVNVSGALGDLLRRGSLIPLLFIVVLLRGAVELTRILRAKGARPHARFVYLMVLFLLTAPWFSAGGWMGSGVAEQEGLMWQLTGVTAAVLGGGALCVWRRDPQGTIRDFGATLLIVLYIGFLGGFGIMLRCGKDVPANEGAWLLLIVLLVTKASDIGAYFTGKAIGRHKLIPTVSPGKSVEGAIGGLAASALAAILFALLPTWLPKPQGTTSSTPLLMLLYDATRSFSLQSGTSSLGVVTRASFIGIMLSLVGQVGDLLESCFKRDGGVKDSGHVIPQYGGILDLVDSPLYAMPVAWFLLTVVWDVA